MAGFDVTIHRKEYRPCFVKEASSLTFEKSKKALFHRWADRAEINRYSGYNGGQLWQVFGIVEYEDGTVHEVYPNDIAFVPGLMDEYDFGERSNDV